MRVFASTTREDLGPGEVDVAASLVLVFADERLAQASVGLAASALASNWLVGERGSLHVAPAYACDTPGEYVLRIGDNSVERRFARKNPIVTLIDAFSSAIQQDGDVEPDGREGMADVRVLEALFESRDTGRSVELRRPRSSSFRLNPSVERTGSQR